MNTMQRNKRCVGKNSKSYNDKHPDNPISLRPIHDAVSNTPKVLDKGRLVPDWETIRAIRSLANLPRMVIQRAIRAGV